MTSVGTVIMDANALIAPGRSGVDVFDEIERVVGAAELLVPEAVVRELRGLARDDPDAELALEMVERECRVVAGDDPERHADDVIVGMAERRSDGEDDDGTGDGADAGDGGTGDEGAGASERSDASVAVATNDAGLRDRLHDVGVPVLFLRQERHVEISYP